MVWPQTRLQNGFPQPTKWYGTNSTLQNGVPLSTILDLFFSNDFDIFIQKWSNMCIPAPKKTPGPFCKASTLSGTQLQGQFFRSHFVGFFTLSQFHPKLISKNVSQFLHVAKPYFFFANNMLTFWKQIETNCNQYSKTPIPLQNGECVGKMGSL